MNCALILLLLLHIGLLDAAAPKKLPVPPYQQKENYTIQDLLNRVKRVETIPDNYVPNQEKKEKNEEGIKVAFQFEVTDRNAFFSWLNKQDLTKFKRPTRAFMRMCNKAPGAEVSHDLYSFKGGKVPQHTIKMRDKKGKGLLKVHCTDAHKETLNDVVYFKKSKREQPRITINLLQARQRVGFNIVNKKVFAKWLSKYRHRMSEEILEKTAMVSLPKTIYQYTRDVAYSLDFYDKDGDKVMRYDYRQKEVPVQFEYLDSIFTTNPSRVGLSKPFAHEQPGLTQLTNIDQLPWSHNATALLLDNHNISCIKPEDIACLKQLESLRINHNNLREIPEKVFSLLPGLKYLEVSDNQLRTLPQSLSSLTKLCDIVASKNKLTTLPDLRSLTRLKQLNISDNQLKTAPNITGLPLEDIFVDGNLFSRSITKKNQYRALTYDDYQSLFARKKEKKGSKLKVKKNAF